MLTILSLGGSIISPDSVDTEFLSSFEKMIRSYLATHQDARLIIVCGGGAPARVYQQAYRTLKSEKANHDQMDWIGVMATRLNAQLVAAIFSDLSHDVPVVTDPAADDITFTGRILVAAGWKPGFSSDTDAVYLAEKFGADKVINLSNIHHVYTADPKTDPNAVPLDTISWEDFRTMIGSTWTPGRNLPFDPIASERASRLGLKVICADGRDTSNTLAILEGKAFNGTTIG
ncbi:UMP kinase [Parasphaerochaeta coccoides]|uniref:Uridylate kinase n=1 Tax=Parasphaerochaeta coccoides (strain ATCC BAA-1237 / DSM 17374 / SPN1) TaxID=760011 RepID=F4GK81_PARC1|nr:UMP kinase [Parasphaerochaeta coccoides]AEC02277.1 uridylate kinase [Parasphaerochaeta coccoides DSM 17374]